jgi:hypothetical protein
METFESAVLVNAAVLPSRPGQSPRRTAETFKVGVVTFLSGQAAGDFSIPQRTVEVIEAFSKARRPDLTKPASVA